MYLSGEFFCIFFFLFLLDTPSEKSYFCPKPETMETMKNFFRSALSAPFAAALLGASVFVSCDDVFPDRPEKTSRTGSICLRFAPVPSLPASRAASAALDTNAFLLTVSDAAGHHIYDGTYGSAPSTLVTAPGSYQIDVRSCIFEEPLFDKPQYGDSQVIVVEAGKTAHVTLDCVQVNSGVRLRTDPSFLAAYPAGVLLLRSDAGRLIYGYTEKRIAYFKPGAVSLVLNEGTQEQTLLTRQLAAQEVLTLRVSAAGQDGSAAGKVSIQVDTSRIWLWDDFTIGGGGSEEHAFSVPEARERAGAADVWVYGYIVGGDLSSSNCSWEAPFKSRTNLVIAAKSSCRDREQCLSVQLSKGDIRDALNLVDHPELLGRQVFFKADIVEAYYGLPGLQNLSGFRLN